MSRAQKKQTDFGKLVERDLAVLAREGRLPAAFGVDAKVTRPPDARP